jgi:hypothetical protein
MVFHCNGYLQDPPENESEKDNGKRRNELRFFSIAGRLPLEIQMVLSNRLYGLSRDLAREL